jgi:exodeoxyribonuclease VII small subunit
MDQKNGTSRKPGSHKPSVGGSAAAATSPPAVMADAHQNLDGTSFEQAVKELEALVAQLDGGDLPLADALAAYQRGSALMRHAQGLLDHVQSQIEVIESGQARSVERTSLISQAKE